MGEELRSWCRHRPAGPSGHTQSSRQPDRTGERDTVTRTCHTHPTMASHSQKASACPARTRGLAWPHLPPPLTLGGHCRQVKSNIPQTEWGLGDNDGRALPCTPSWAWRPSPPARPGGRRPSAPLPLPPTSAPGPVIRATSGRPEKPLPQRGSPGALALMSAPSKETPVFLQHQSRRGQA